MVKDTRTTAGASHIRALNEPQSVAVKAEDDGLPTALKLRRRWVLVEALVDRWRIDDEWWRERPVSRMYYECLVDQGLHMTVFHDLMTGEWYQQAS